MFKRNEDNIIYDVLHLINKKYSFLELGTGDGFNFSRLKNKDKASVDISPKGNPTFCMSTDDFFEINNKKYDICYIDASHVLENVLKDINNCISMGCKFILIHDLYPKDLHHANPSLCGDGYKLLAYLMEKIISGEIEADAFTCIEDHGQTLFHDLNEPVDLKNFPYYNLSYKDFLKIFGSCKKRGFKVLNKEDFINSCVKKIEDKLYV